MTQTEKTGLGIAIAMHVLVFAALSFRFADAPNASFANPPMAVDIITETAPVSTAPEPSEAPPAARLGDPDSRQIEPPPPPPAAVIPSAPAPIVPRVMPDDPPARTAPRPTPRSAPRPTPRVAPPRATPPRTTPPRSEPRTAQTRPPRNRPADTRPAAPSRQTAQNSAATRSTARPARDPRPTGALDGIAAGVARDARLNTRAAAPPAAATASAIRADIRVSINAEVRSPWNGCRVTGIDVDQLTTTVVFRLTETGALDRFVSVTTRGLNDSNRPQLQRFEECARRAIQVAAPFSLPAEQYSFWQTYTLDFEKR